MIGKRAQTLLWKIKIEHISGSTVWNVINLILLYAQVEVYQNILKLRCWPLAFKLYKAFLKIKKVSATRFPVSFAAYFLEKIFLPLYSINWPNFIARLLLLLELLGNMCIVIIYCSTCDVINLEINLNVLIKRFFYRIKSKDKNVNISKTKRAFNKAFFILFKGLLVVRNCLRPESRPFKA